MKFTLRSRAVVEFVGTAFLLMAVVGSGIMAERLCAGNVGLALLANSVATGAALVALILALAPISGAHFNPAVSLAARALRSPDSSRVIAPDSLMALTPHLRDCGSWPRLPPRRGRSRRGGLPRCDLSSPRWPA